eukprot:scaffold1173_cov405-Prasinococcus_capsulatus_cf.AAC.15
MPARSVDGFKAGELIRGKKQATLLDVRFRDDYEIWKVPGSVNVQWIRAKGDKKFGFLARIPGLFKEKNPDFVKEVEKAFPDKNAAIIVGCILGGDLSEPPAKDPRIGKGKQVLVDPTKADSLLAINEMLQLGYTNLYHLAGGFNQYYESSVLEAGAPPSKEEKSWDGELPWEGDWCGDLEIFAYRQFRAKDPRFGYLGWGALNNTESTHCEWPYPAAMVLKLPVRTTSYRRLDAKRLSQLLFASWRSMSSPVT